MKRRVLATAAVVLLFALAGCSLGYDTADSDRGLPDSASVGELGHYNGYWYNESLAIDATDGLNETEQEAVFSRAMARVQLLRGTTFRREADIELITRETFREEYGDVTAPNPPEGVRTLDNAQHEALFLVESDRDVVDVRQGNRGDLVLGFYRPGEGITLVSERDPPTLPNEYTLAHELVHALQDQRFGLASIQGQTIDQTNARNGLIEGGAGLVGVEYRNRCESGDWECVGVREEPIQPGTGPEFHFGVYFVDFFPYAEGPTFVEYHRERAGWDAVDAIYEDLPNASAEVIHPSTYGSDAYGTARLEDRSDKRWQRVRTDRKDHATVGQAGLVAMFAYTAYTDDGAGEAVVAIDDFENVGEGGRLDRRQPFSYDLSYASGWYADRMHAYENGGETAIVWNVTFDDRANASEFREGYAAVIDYWGGNRHEVRSGGAVWTLDGERFDGAVWVHREGRSVTVVKAPDDEALGGVYDPASDSADDENA